jgi:hypothetical protein
MAQLERWRLTDYAASFQSETYYNIAAQAEAPVTLASFIDETSQTAIISE